MQQSFGYSFALIMLAGVMNGSFVIPMRYFSAFNQEKNWLYHSVIGCVILPWLCLLVISPASLHNFSLLPITMLLFLVGSGLIFGVGQIGFAQAITCIGIGRSFTINLSVGVALGSFFVVVYRHLLLSLHGAHVVFAIGLINLGLYLHYRADTSNQHGELAMQRTPPHFRRGWLLALFAGLTSGLQNIAFVVTAFHLPHAGTKLDAFWIWPAFLTAAAFPMILGFGVYLKGAQTQTSLTMAALVKTLLAITGMGLLFTGSLVFYSHAMMKMTHQQQITAWPTFMVTIILTSQAWDKATTKQVDRNNLLRHKKNKHLQYASVALCLIAILILAANQ